MIHLDCLSLHEVLVGTTVEVTREGVTTTHVLAPGLVTYLSARYADHPTIAIQSLNGAAP